ncbi:MAG: respiratory chain complex I subunit 1 family protein [Candidatus Sericytochromatia bacterium]
MISVHNWILLLLQALLLIGLAPGVNGLMKKLKAMFQGRQGPPLLQGYFDLHKYFLKETVISEQASWIFRFTPAILFATSLAAGLMVPAFSELAPLSWLGGIVALAYLLGLGRFFMVSAAMEPGGSFSSMAASRETLLATVIEPVLMLALFVLALMAGSTNFTGIIHWLTGHHAGFLSPAHILAALVLLTAGIAEMGRIPFDNPATHYELTMIHEGMLLDYSGPLLGMMLWAGWVKQLMLLSLLANIALPIGLAANLDPAALLPALAFWLVKIALLCLLVELVETLVVKVRLFRVKEILGGAFVLSIICVVVLVASLQTGQGGFLP